MQTIHFRPHHFLCALCFQGRGYSPAFVANFSAIMLWLENNAAALCIEIVNHIDSICEPCPNHQQTKCLTQTKIEKLDQAHAQELHWQIGDRFSWDQAKAQIRQHLTLDKFHRMCTGCSWKNYGICEEVIKNFLTL